MRHIALLPLTLLFGSSFAFSQSSTQQAFAKVTSNMMGASCPVSLQAQHGPGALVQTKDRSPEPAQRLKLYWGNLHRKDIVAATILVRGYDATPRFLPVNYAAPQLKRTFNLVVDVASHGKTTTDLTARSFATVSWIDLKSIEYADGSRWNISQRETCRISLNGFMLIAAAVAR